MASFRVALFRLFLLELRLFVWRISLFRLFAWRYFVFSPFSRGVFSSLCVALKTKRPNGTNQPPSVWVCSYIMYSHCDGFGFCSTVLIFHFSVYHVCSPYFQNITNKDCIWINYILMQLNDLTVPFKHLLVAWDQREYSEKSEINDWFRLIF